MVIGSTPAEDRAVLFFCRGFEESQKALSVGDDMNLRIKSTVTCTPPHPSPRKKALLNSKANSSWVKFSIKCFSRGVGQQEGGRGLNNQTLVKHTTLNLTECTEPERYTNHQWCALPPPTKPWILLIFLSEWGELSRLESNLRSCAFTQTNTRPTKQPMPV